VNNWAKTGASDLLPSMTSPLLLRQSGKCTVRFGMMAAMLR
jgi:hypothetical protein